MNIVMPIIAGFAIFGAGALVYWALTSVYKAGKEEAERKHYLGDKSLRYEQEQMHYNRGYRDGLTASRMVIDKFADAETKKLIK